MFKKIDASEAAKLIHDSSTVSITGFVGAGYPECIAKAIEKSFLETGHPNNLTLTHSAGIGESKSGGRGVNVFAHEGLVKACIVPHFNLAPDMQKLVGENAIEGYLLPQGALTQLYRETGAGRPGVITKIGIGTFVDPRLEGGKCNESSKRDMVEVVELGGEEYLWYKSFPIDVALIRCTSADEHGNLTVEKESTILDQLAMALAAKRSGGIVIAQVERIVCAGSLNPRDVIVPGVMVDYVVVAPPEMHWQNFGNEVYDPALGHEFRVPLSTLPIMKMSARKIIARRAAMELIPNAVINLGIGTPESIASIAVEEGFSDQVIMTVESGHIGGVPAGGLLFGGSYNPDYVVDTTRQFDFYDGGGLDVCFLGAAEVDAMGNVNVSKFKKIVGPGGFINIAQSTPRAVFCGTLMAGGLEVAVKDGKLIIVSEGRTKKFVETVQQITYAGSYGIESGQYVRYVTERCVFELGKEGIELIEIAPGIDLKTQVLDMVEFPVKVSENLKEMDSRIFNEGKMGFSLD